MLGQFSVEMLNITEWPRIEDFKRIAIVQPAMSLTSSFINFFSLD